MPSKNQYQCHTKKKIDGSVICKAVNTTVLYKKGNRTLPSQQPGQNGIEVT